MSSARTRARLRQLRGRHITHREYEQRTNTTVSVSVASSSTGAVDLEMRAHRQAQFDETLIASLTESEAEQLMQGLRRSIEE